jgi:hypothetical protein
VTSNSIYIYICVCVYVCACVCTLHTCLALLLFCICMKCDKCLHFVLHWEVAASDLSLGISSCDYDLWWLFSLFQGDVRVVPGSRPQFLCMSFPIQYSVIRAVDKILHNLRLYLSICVHYLGSWDFQLFAYNYYKIKFYSTNDFQGMCSIHST